MGVPRSIFVKRGFRRGFAKLGGPWPGVYPPKEVALEESVPRPWRGRTTVRIRVQVCCANLDSTRTVKITLHRCPVFLSLSPGKQFCCCWQNFMQNIVCWSLNSNFPASGWLPSIDSFKLCWHKYLCVWKGAFAWVVEASHLLDEQFLPK